MNKVQYHQRTIKQLYLAYAPQISSVFVRNYCIEGKSGGTITNAKEQDSSDKDPETINFKQISTENIEVEKDLNEQISLLTEDIGIEDLTVPKRNTFISLLRRSKFMDVNIKCFVLLHNLTFIAFIIFVLFLSCFFVLFKQNPSF